MLRRRRRRRPLLLPDSLWNWGWRGIDELVELAGVRSYVTSTRRIFPRIAPENREESFLGSENQFYNSSLDSLHLKSLSNHDYANLGPSHEPGAATGSSAIVSSLRSNRAFWKGLMGGRDRVGPIRMVCLSSERLTFVD